MKNYFKPEDFKTYYTSDNDSMNLMVDIANEKLNAMIESWPVVYDGDAGISCFKEDTWGYVKYDENNHSMISSNFRNSKRKARLAFIEDIVKESCKHEPLNYAYEFDKNTGITTNELYKCKHCGIELVADWKAK